NRVDRGHPKTETLRRCPHRPFRGRRRLPGSRSDPAQRPRPMAICPYHESFDRHGSAALARLQLVAYVYVAATSVLSFAAEARTTPTRITESVIVCGSNISCHIERQDTQ